MRESAVGGTLCLVFAINPDRQGRRPRDPTARTGGREVQPPHLHILGTGWPELVIRAHTMDTTVVTLMSPPAATFAEICVYQGGDSKKQRTKCGSRRREGSHAKLDICPEEEVVM